MTTLFDQHARDTITHALDRTLFVEAGAGTGKTSALVARVATLIRSGVEVRAIAAITFTEAAAAELRERVRDALESLARGDTPYVPAFQMAAQHLVARERLDDARRVLREGIEEARRQGNAHAAREMSELLMGIGAAGE